MAKINWKEWFIYICILVGTIFVCKCVLFFGIVPSGSMVSTIQEGDIIVGSRLNTETIERYDVIIFRYPDDPSQYFVKRVIGLPGETVEVRNGVVYVDGEKMRDNFVAELSYDSGTYIVPEGSYFVMGDNRNNSNDSRYWNNKYVGEDMILARAKCVLWHEFREIK